MKNAGLNTLERRVNQRLTKEAYGEFLSKDSSPYYGAMHMLDYSHNGIRARIGRLIVPGSRLALKVNFKDNSVPAFSSGRIIWFKEKNENSEELYEIGIHLDEYDGIEEKKTQYLSCSNEYLNKVAEYAISCGNMAANKSGKNIAFSPGLFIAYFFIGAVISFANPILTFLFTLSIFFLTFRTLFRNRKGITGSAFREKRGIFAIPQIIKNSAATLLIQICYGIFFIYGLVSGILSKTIRQMYDKFCPNN